MMAPIAPIIMLCTVNCSRMTKHTLQFLFFCHGLLPPFNQFLYIFAYKGSGSSVPSLPASILRWHLPATRSVYHFNFSLLTLRISCNIDDLLAAVALIHLAGATGSTYCKRIHFARPPDVLPPPPLPTMLPVPDIPTVGQRSPVAILHFLNFQCGYLCHFLFPPASLIFIVLNLK